MPHNALSGSPSPCRVEAPRETAGSDLETDPIQIQKRRLAVGASAGVCEWRRLALRCRSRRREQRPGRQRRGCQGRHARCAVPGESGGQVALDGRDALGGNQVYLPGRFDPCSCRSRSSAAQSISRPALMCQCGTSSTASSSRPRSVRPARSANVHATTKIRR
jgi:hypothetical protein